MKEQGMINASPTLVIGAGEFAASMLSQVRTLFLRNDPHRTATVGFYKAGVVGKEQHESILEPIGRQQEQQSLGLETALHDLRLHEKFLQVGLGEERDLPLGVIVLVDLTEDGSDSLYPLMKILCERMAQERGGYIYLLCRTAVFKTDPLKDVLRARVHLHLEKMKTQVQPGAGELQTYLFDGLKEGSLEAKDDDEVSILMQNFLLALLCGGLAQRLAHVYALSEKGEVQEFFNSAGTTALIYDPSTLQESCAKQLAKATLEAEFLSPVSTDPRQIEKAVTEISAKIGTLKEWGNNLCKDTPYRVDPGGTLQLDLHFSDLQFDGLPPQEWGDAIAGYALHFEKQVRTLYIEMLAKNSSILAQAVSKSLKSQLWALPARMDLYPNGIANSLHVLQECARAFHQRIQDCLATQNEEQTLAWLDGEYQASMECLDQAISDLPDPPRWVKRLPGKLYTFAGMLFEFIFLRAEHAQLLLLREKIVRTLEDKYLFVYEVQVRNTMVELLKQLVTSLEVTQSELNELQAKLHNLQNRLAQDLSTELSVSSPFRVYLGSPALLEWAYVHGSKSSTTICTDLLESGFLADWQNSSEEHLGDRLMLACQPAHQFLYDLRADALLQLVDLADRSPYLAILAQGAVPPLRPDFDTTGERSSYLMNYFLCDDPRKSRIRDMLKASVYEWQEITTGDPYLIIFCRVRQMIPRNALSWLTQSTAAAFSRLSADVQKDLQDRFEGQQ